MIDEDDVKDELDRIFAREEAEEMLARLPKDSFFKKLRGLFRALFGDLDIS